MSEFTLHRMEDPSGVSGTGNVAWGVEWPDGSVAIRWPGEHPSTASWNDIRDAEAVHGHGGRTIVQYSDDSRLLESYKRVMPFILSEGARMLPVVVNPHPDQAGRLRLIFHDERHWSFWIALLEGSTFAASHTEVAGEMQHTWVSPDGDLWLQYFTPLADDNDPLEIFHREDR